MSRRLQLSPALPPSQLFFSSKYKQNYRTSLDGVVNAGHTLKWTLYEKLDSNARIRCTGNDARLKAAGQYKCELDTKLNFRLDTWKEP